MKTEKLTIEIDTEKNSAEVEIEMSAGNLVIAAGRILTIAADAVGMDETKFALSLLYANQSFKAKEETENEPE